MASHRPAPQSDVSVIVPARNEEASLGDCLASLVTQTGVPFEIIVIDDYSTDRTRQIAESFAGVRVISPPPLEPGWTGKNNALWAGVQKACGEWLLFTDADTVHAPGSLARALAEAKEHGADMLSYSPEQIAVTFWEMAVLPVVFAELARQYPPKKVSDPASPIAAANGQYILIRRDLYQAVGGHRAIAGDLLEDVALARSVKSSGHKLRFRYAADAVRTRMYRNFQQLREGWTKNLALLFPRPGRLAISTFLRWVLPWALMTYPVFLILFNITGLSAARGWFPHQFYPWRLIWIASFCLLSNSLYRRLRLANFDLAMEFFAASFGYPMVAYLLLRSKMAHANGQVSWKERNYGGESDLTNRLASCDQRTSAAKARIFVGSGRHG